MVSVVTPGLAAGGEAFADLSLVADQRLEFGQDAGGGSD